MLSPATPTHDSAQVMDFEQFVTWYPEGQSRYELRRGVVVEIMPTGDYEEMVEVVSTNWQDDYLVKLADYERMEIPECWILDYWALGGRRYIDSPKTPTLSVYQWIDGEYQVEQFRGSERIRSAIFPELTLSAEQIFAIVS